MLGSTRERLASTDLCTAKLVVGRSGYLRKSTGKIDAITQKADLIGGVAIVLDLGEVDFR